MNIGDRVTINKRLAENGNHKTWMVMDIRPTEVVYLGTGQRWDGGWQQEYSDADGPGESIWVNTKCHNVYIVQPIDKGKRYRLPIAVPKDGVQA